MVPSNPVWHDPSGFAGHLGIIRIPADGPDGVHDSRRCHPGRTSADCHTLTIASSTSSSEAVAKVLA